MSVQILLHGKILGVEEFLLAGAPEELLFTGRLRWISLLSEVLPRALIGELGLSKMLLGSSGGEQFLVVLPQEFRAQAEEFLVAAREGFRQLSDRRVDLLWSITENLGDWTVVRKRLNEAFQRKQDAARLHRLCRIERPRRIRAALFRGVGYVLRDANAIGWSPDSPAKISAGQSKQTWSIGSAPIRFRWRGTPL